MIKAREMAEQMRRVAYMGPNVEYARQAIAWLDSQGDSTLGLQMEGHLQQIFTEMCAGGVKTQTIRRYLDEKRDYYDDTAIDAPDDESEEWSPESNVPNDGLTAITMGFTPELYAGNMAEDAKRAEEVLRIVKENKDGERQQVISIVKGMHHILGMSQREIVQRLKGTISQRTVGRILRDKWGPDER